MTHSSVNPQPTTTRSSSWVDRLLGWIREQKPPLPLGFLLLGCTLLLLSICSSFVLWPKGDEADYLYQARLITEGKLPYRDFFTFITPLGQYWSALILQVSGLNIVAIRSVSLMAWLIEMRLLFLMARHWVSPAWAWLLVGFLWFTDTRYLVNQHHLWSGFTALLGVYAIFRHFTSTKPSPKYLIWAGFYSGLTIWITQSLGVLMGLGLAGFVLLTERDRWRMWLLRFGLPFLTIQLIGLGLIVFSGLWPHFYRDSIQWLVEGNYLKTTTPGYFATFQEEWRQTLLPLLQTILPWELKLIFTNRIFVAFHLLLISITPGLALLGGGYLLYSARKTGNPNRQLLWLVWISALMMTLSTLSYATSMHIVSNSGLVFMLGFVVTARLVQATRFENLTHNLLVVFYALLLVSYIMGCWLHLTFGTWLPQFRTMIGRTLFSSYAIEAQQLLDTVNTLNKAAAENRSVFIMHQTPELYLAGTYANATRFTLVMPGYTSLKQQQEIITDLEAKKPVYIVDDQSLNELKHDPRYTNFTDEMRKLPLMAHYLSVHYHLLQRHGRYAIYTRSD